jgi:hypothetical protein
MITRRDDVIITRGICPDVLENYVSPKLEEEEVEILHSPPF